jgi:hypothetical protein
MNGSILSWYGPSDNPQGTVISALYNATLPSLDAELTTGCQIAMIDGQLYCPSTSGISAPPSFVKPLNSSNSLTGDSSMGLAVIVDSQIIWMMPTGGVRYGGAAQRPRSQFVRTVSIAPTPNGVDAPFCGIDDSMFKPCATIDYAMNNIDSLGSWVTYICTPGTYTITSTITISYAGVTIKSRDGIGSVTFICSECVSIAAPSTRIVGIIFSQTNTAVSVLPGTSV